MKKIHSQTNTTIAEITQRGNTELERIKREEHVRLKKIESDERLKVLELHSQYEIDRQKQKDERERIKMVLREDIRRSNIRIKDTKKVQAELSQIVQVITKKVINNSATESELSLLPKILDLETQMLHDSYNLSEGLFNLLVQGE